MKTHLPCPSCGSSDALAEYEEGTYCFSCKKYTKKVVDFFNLEEYNSSSRTNEENSSWDLIEINNNNNRNYTLVNTKVTYECLPFKGLNIDTVKFYGIYTKIDENGKPTSVGYVYPNKAVKVSSLEKKEFFSQGPMAEAGCFGTDKFSAGMSRCITITEGEKDAASVYQMLGSKYPAISVRSSSSARRDCERDYKYINAFEKIYLCFDSDEPGQKALQDVARLFDPNKTYHVKLSRFKDANDYLTNNSEKEFVSCWYNARKFLPKGIISDYAEIETILNKKDAGVVAHYPFETIDSMSYGIRLGEITLFMAPEKVGKTEVMRSIEYHLLKTTDYNIGIIHLEEPEKRSVQGLIGYELSMPVHLPDTASSVDEQVEAFKRLTRKDGRLHFYSHFGSDDPDAILGVVRYLVAVCGCKFIFLDHITMLVTGFEGDDERKKLDYISTRLAMMTKELEFHLFLVSHVNDAGQARGSRNIPKIADLLLFLERDIENPSEEVRNQIKITCRGNRFGGSTGPAGVLRFDRASFKLTEEKIKKHDQTVEEQPFDPTIRMDRFKLPESTISVS